MSDFFMHSGHRVDLAAVRAEDARLPDLAWHLAREPRWVNATTETVTVLEHLLYCDDLACTEKNDEVWGHGEFGRLRICILLHDVEEAYTGDPPSGLKDAVPALAVYMVRLRATIFAALGVRLMSPPEAEFVKHYDHLSATYEAMHYMRTGNALGACRRAWGVEAPRLHMNRHEPASAEREWLRRLADLGVTDNGKES